MNNLGSGSPGDLLLVYVWYQGSEKTSLVPGARENGEAPGTHCLRMRLISPRCGDSGLF